MIDIFKDKELFVISKNNYGSEVFYPDCDSSKFFTDIHGTKTLTDQLMKMLKLKGYTFSIKPRRI